MAVQWAAEQLTTYLAALSATGDRATMLRCAVDLAAESLEAEVVAYVEGEDVPAVTGYPSGRAPVGTLVELARARSGAVDLPGLGTVTFHSAGLDEPGARLVAARTGTGSFTDDDATLLRGMARVLGLSLRASEQLRHERDRRTDSEREAADVRDLLRSVEERQELLERLTRIQRSITGQAPLHEVLDSIVVGARELTDSEIVVLRCVDPTDPTTLVVVATHGDVSMLPRELPVGRWAAGRSFVEDTLVVGDPDNLPEGFSAAMGAPVREKGVPVGTLTVGSVTPGRTYTRPEQETLSSFAAHASLALSEAHTAEALRGALDAARHDALHDVLTGLPNRALLRDRLDHASARAKRNPRDMALLFLDIDNFKHINDSLGHDAGDALLVSVARRLSELVRPVDTIARLGGDEFAVLIEEMASEAEAEDLANRLLHGLAEPVEVMGRQVEVSASVGIAVWDTLGEAHDLLSNADLAMYEAKRAGGGRGVLFEPGMHERTMARLDIEHELRPAIESGQLVVHYQPVVEISTGLVSTFEALVRWQHPTRGLLGPNEFIPVAESSRLIRALGDEVLRQAVAEAVTWPADVHLAVNLSPRELTPDLPDRVAGRLAEAGLVPQRLTVEVTEGLVMADSDAFAVIDQLHGLGVRVAIDDFGTGYSSLSRLRSLPVDILKVDQTFVRAVNTNDGLAIIGAILALGKASGLATVAEGVETPGQLRALTELGCDYAQGFLLSRPVTQTAVRELFGSSLIPAQCVEAVGLG
jgi:diguanylate cyclase (GGDEF)-like protein